MSEDYEQPMPPPAEPDAPEPSDPPTDDPDTVDEPAPPDAQ